MPAINSFQLEEEIDELSYNFATKANPTGPTGVIPEPSSKQIETFRRKLRTLMGPVLDAQLKAADMTPAERVAALNDVEDGGDGDTRTHDMLVAVAEICSNQPSVEQIEALPFRGQQVFIGWIVGVFLNPNSPTPATS